MRGDSSRDKESVKSLKTRPCFEDTNEACFKEGSTRPHSLQVQGTKNQQSVQKKESLNQSSLSLLQAAQRSRSWVPSSSSFDDGAKDLCIFPAYKR